MRARLITLWAICAACAAESAPASQEIELHFRADPGPPGSERYLCFGFDAALVGDAIVGVEVDAPVGGPVALHHVALYAVPDAAADGPSECLFMPPLATELDVWSPGGAPLLLPSGVGLILPEGSTHLVVQAHALRYDEGEAPEAIVRVTSTTAMPEHHAAVLPARAPIPALRPHMVETSTAACHLAGAAHIVSTRPHMHQIGVAFHGAILRADGTREPLIDVDPWQLDAQQVYPVDVALEAGDAVETTCVWRNDGDDYVFAGPGIDDEMCVQSLILWPAESARCAD